MLTFNFCTYFMEDEQHTSQYRDKPCTKLSQVLKWCLGYGATETLIHSWWEYKVGWSLWKALWQLLKKLSIVLLYDPAIGSGIYPRIENACPPKHLHTKVYSNFMHNCQISEATEILLLCSLRCCCLFVG